MTVYFSIAGVILIFLWVFAATAGNLKKDAVLCVAFAVIWPLFVVIWAVGVIVANDEEAT